jgi:hypothetical protein
MTVCWAPSEAQAKRTAREIWPNAALSGELSQELPTPAHFEQATSKATAEQVAESVICGPDPERHLEAVREYEQAGFTHVFVHQIGPDQYGFLRFYAERILPRL